MIGRRDRGLWSREREKLKTVKIARACGGFGRFPEAGGAE
jgi:hypothetical protein